MTNAGPVGTIRNPIMVLALSYVCGVPAIFYLLNMIRELNDFRRKDDASFIMCLLLIGWFSLPEKVVEAKRMAGIPNPQTPNPILYLLLWPYFLTEDLNEVWKAAGQRP